MRALILNSGMGTRLGSLTKDSPKCLTKINDEETILSRQLKLLSACKIKDAVITTGPFEDKLKAHCREHGCGVNITFVNNPLYRETNYIYSIYEAREYLDDDIVMLHGDLVFSKEALEKIISSKTSSMAVDFTEELPEKDFKAVIENGKISKIGIEFFENAAAAQPLYKLLKKDWSLWLKGICAFCEEGNRKCYAENAFNLISRRCEIYPTDVSGMLCREVDTVEDLELVKKLFIG